MAIFHGMFSKDIKFADPEGSASLDFCNPAICIHYNEICENCQYRNPESGILSGDVSCSGSNDFQFALKKRKKDTKIWKSP